MEIISAVDAAKIAYDARTLAREKRDADTILNEMHQTFVNTTLEKISATIEDRAKNGFNGCSYVLYDEDFFVCNDRIKLSAGLIVSYVTRKLKMLGYTVDYFSSYPAYQGSWSTDEFDYTLNIKWGAF